MPIFKFFFVFAAKKAVGEKAEGLIEAEPDR